MPHLKAEERTYLESQEKYQKNFDIIIKHFTNNKRLFINFLFFKDNEILKGLEDNIERIIDSHDLSFSPESPLLSPTLRYLASTMPELLKLNSDDSLDINQLNGRNDLRECLVAEINRVLKSMNLLDARNQVKIKELESKKKDAGAATK